MTQSLKAFEAFKAEIAESDEPIETLLEDRFDEAAEVLAHAFAQPERPQRIQAVLDFGLMAMAISPGEEEGLAHYSGDYAWLRIAQAKLQEKAGEQPAQYDVLLGTIFFTDKPELRRGLNRLICASTEPGGWYEHELFKNGVALGRVAIATRSYED